MNPLLKEITMAGLAVNVDHIATLRQARGTRYPDPVAAAVIAELAGADAIVAHLREDRRHIQDRDVRLLRQVVQTRLVLEMAVTREMIGIALDIKPDLVTLVPERREEVTTEGGLDLAIRRDEVAEAVQNLKSAGIPVSIFIDPNIEQIKLAHKINADMVEIHTGTFCEERSAVRREKAFEDIVTGAKMASKLKMGVNAGHGISYESIKAFAGLQEIDEFSIGHSIVSRAALVGMENAVREMKILIDSL
jgi:pyridoxine 5-phosphate synthase